MLEDNKKRVVKRDGRESLFMPEKIENAIKKAFVACGNEQSEEAYKNLVGLACNVILSETPHVEEIQDAVEQVLMTSGYTNEAKSYVLYRAKRTRVREMNTTLMGIYKDLTYSSAEDSDIKRENANVNGNTAMGTMLKYGSEGAKRFYDMHVLESEFSEAHKKGDIHIHDLDFYTLTTTCTQIDLIKLFKDGFSTGHGFLREPNSIQSYSALACIAIQSNQNDQHGGQSIVNFDTGLAPGVRKTFIKELCKLVEVKLRCEGITDNKPLKYLSDVLNEYEGSLLSKEGLSYSSECLWRIVPACYSSSKQLVNLAVEYTDKATYQAMEALIHNLNTMHSRAGAQVPFSSINYGMAIDEESRMVMKNVLLATERGLGNGETPIFPIQIFRVKEGVNLNPEDPNYDLFQLACRCSAKRLFPNFSFQDAPFNAKYYKGTPDTEISYMGCRTRVIANVHDPEQEVSNGRGNLSFTTINLPRLALLSKGDYLTFFKLLDDRIDLVVRQLLHRFKIQSAKTVKNFPFLMGNSVWLGSEKLSLNDSVGEVLKHGSLSVGFIGLAEALIVLTGSHHGESTKSQQIGISIIEHMRRRVDEYADLHKLNFTLLATPAEGLSGRFVKIDRSKFGFIENVTDREYYTNSFHVPVYFPIPASKKIRIEAPYHAFTNAGHITYVELDGDPLDNLPAFESIIRYMHECGIGYGSINHPVDRDPICGYTGIIKDECPRCGRRDGEAVSVEKLKELRKQFPNMPKICGCE